MAAAAARPLPDLARAASAATSGGYSLLEAAAGEDGEANGARRLVVWDLAELQDMRDTQVAEVADLLGMEADEAALCLCHFRWDSDALTETYFDDPSGIRQRLHVREGPGPVAGTCCDICFSEPAAVDVLPCTGHGCCEGCWSRYISIAVQEGKGCLDLRCPTPKCGERLRETQVRRLCAPGLAARYERFCLEAFVEESQERKWCPGAGCSLACGRATEGGHAVRCLCGMEWCFDCSNDEHQPVSCGVVRRWNEKMVDLGNDDAKWIFFNTKPCPKCNNPIEKDGGCMHMTCRKPGGCGHEFCWICMKNWAGHGFCNEFVEEDSTDARLGLLRYEHFWERFNAHEAAQQVSAGAMKDQMAALVACFTAEKLFSVNDVEFLVAAAAQIGRGRRFLKWTFALAFFMEAPGEAGRLFEFHQAQLEGTLERLSDLLENTRWEAFLGAASKMPFWERRAQTVSLTAVVRDFFESLRAWVEETFPGG